MLCLVRSKQFFAHTWATIKLVIFVFLFFCVRHSIQTFLRWWFNNCWFHTQFVSLLFILLWNWSLQINFHITWVQSEAENLFTRIYVHIRSDEATGCDCFLFLLWLCAHFFTSSIGRLLAKERKRNGTITCATPELLKPFAPDSFNLPASFPTRRATILLLQDRIKWVNLLNNHGAL